MHAKGDFVHGLDIINVLIGSETLIAEPSLVILFSWHGA
jgi:hypothetical protein